MAVRSVCILGGSGFVGGHLAARLAKLDIRSRIITRHPRRAQHLKVNNGLELVTADPFNTEALSQRFEGCDAVINLIGILNESGANNSFRRIHVELVDQVVNACRQAGIERMIHMSALNADQASGSSEYLRSKGEGANRAHTHGGASMAVTSIRPSVIFGPGDHFFNRFADLLKLSPYFFPLACPNSRFAPVYVGDVTQAIARTLDNHASFGRHYDLCGPNIYSLAELVRFTADSIGLRRTVIGLNDGLSRLQARLFGQLPGKPFSLDNYDSLQTDSVCQSNHLAQLGIRPHSIEAMVPMYLSSQGYRRHLAELRTLS